MRPDRSGGGPYMDAEEDYGDGGQQQQWQHRDPVATLYAPVLPNAHPVRLEGKQHPRKEGQLPPLNPLYVRRFAADIARYARGGGTPRSPRSPGSTHALTQSNLHPNSKQGRRRPPV